MKVALCFSGLLRTYRETYPALEKHILRHYDCDIFISTWDICGFSNYKRYYCHGRRFPEEAVRAEDVQGLYGHCLRKLKIESFAETQSQFVTNHTGRFTYHTPDVVQRILSMHYKIKSANDMRKDYEENNEFQYDVVVRSRTDLWHTHKVDLFVPDRQVVIVPAKSWPSERACNDQFAFGDRASIDMYCSLYDEIPKYEGQTDFTFAEGVLWHHLAVNQHAASPRDIRYEIYLYGQQKPSSW